jgi:signal peptidase II
MAEPAATRPLPPHRFWLLALIAFVVYLLDQLTKIIVVANLTPGESPKILGGLIYFSLIRNPGAAFSMATGMTWVLAVIAVIVVVVIIRIATRLRSVWWAVSLGLILGGALGNLTDRIFRSPGFFRGHVVDFISVFGPDGQYFPIFNVADSAITVGGILLVLTALQGIEFDGSRSGKRAKATERPAPERPAPERPAPERPTPDRPAPDRPATDV